VEGTKNLRIERHRGDIDSDFTGGDVFEVQEEEGLEVKV
jgi:hypothetical protein